MANKARQRGHRFERSMMSEFKQMGWKDCMTARYASRLEDDKGVDLCKTNPINLQCKHSKTTPSIKKLLFEKMPEDNKFNVVVWKKAQPGRGKKILVFISRSDFKEINNMYKTEFEEYGWDKTKKELLASPQYQKFFFEKHKDKDKKVLVCDYKKQDFAITFLRWGEFKKIIKKLKQESII